MGRSPVRAPTFLLGLGAQKAGTTWLHRYLMEAPSFAPGALKEYHLWNAIHRVDEGGPPQFIGTNPQAKEDLRAAMVAEPRLYFEHFASLLAGGSATLAADITPAYAGLPASVLTNIRDDFAKRGIRTKAIFVMRDPVERCWSAARMYHRRKTPVAGLDLALGELEFVRRYARTGNAGVRGRYERTVGAIEEVFGPEDRYFAFYEELFSPTGLQNLSGFLGLAPRPDAAQIRHNTGARENDLPDSVRAEIAALFADTLAFCRTRFPETLNLWESYRWHRAPPWDAALQ